MCLDTLLLCAVIDDGIILEEFAGTQQARTGTLQYRNLKGQYRHLTDQYRLQTSTDQYRPKAIAMVAGRGLVGIQLVTI